MTILTDFIISHRLSSVPVRNDNNNTQVTLFIELLISTHNKRITKQNYNFIVSVSGYKKKNNS